MSRPQHWLTSGPLDRTQDSNPQRVGPRIWCINLLTPPPCGVTFAGVSTRRRCQARPTRAVKLPGHPLFVFTSRYASSDTLNRHDAVCHSPNSVVPAYPLVNLLFQLTLWSICCSSLPFGQSEPRKCCLKTAAKYPWTESCCRQQRPEQV